MCVQRVQDQRRAGQQLFTEAFLLVPKCADAVPNHLKKCGGNDSQLVHIVSCYLLSVALREAC